MVADAGVLAVKADRPVHRAVIRMLQPRLEVQADPRAADAAVSAA